MCVPKDDRIAAQLCISRCCSGFVKIIKPLEVDGVPLSRPKNEFRDVRAFYNDNSKSDSPRKLYPCAIISDESFPFRKCDLVSNSTPNIGTGSGWLLQQLLKLYAFKVLGEQVCDHLLVCDADVIWTKSVSFLGSPVNSIRPIHSPSSSKSKKICSGTNLGSRKTPDSDSARAKSVTTNNLQSSNTTRHSDCAVDSTKGSSDEYEGLPEKGHALQAQGLYTTVQPEWIPNIRSRIDIWRYDDFVESLLGIIKHHPGIGSLVKNGYPCLTRGSKRRPKRETAVVHHMLFFRKVCQMFYPFYCYIMNSKNYDVSRIIDNLVIPFVSRTCCVCKVILAFLDSLEYVDADVKGRTAWQVFEYHVLVNLMPFCFTKTMTIDLSRCCLPYEKALIRV